MMRGYPRFIMGRTLTLAGSQVVTLALMWMTVRLHLPLLSGLVGALLAFPALGATFVGTWVARRPKLLVMGSFGAEVGAILTFIVGSRHVGVILGVALVVGVASTIQWPAMQSLAAVFAEGNQSGRRNARFLWTERGAVTLIALLTGWGLVVTSLGWLLVFAQALIVVGTMVLLPTIGQLHPRSQGRPPAMFAGIRHVLSIPFLRAAIGAGAVQLLGTSLFLVAIPWWAQRISASRSSVWYGAALSAMGAGAILGYVIGGRWQIRRIGITQGCLSLAAGAVVLPIPWMPALVGLLLMTAHSVFDGTRGVLTMGVQQRLLQGPNMMLSFAAVLSLVHITQPLATIAGGVLLSSSHGLVWVFIAMGATMMLSGVMRLIIPASRTMVIGASPAPDAEQT